MHVQTKHNVHIQIQKITRQTLMHANKNEQEYKRFKFISFYRLGGSY
jgi:hypothetical protein